MSQEVVVRPPQLPQIEELQIIEQIAGSLSRSTFVPRAYQGKPGDIIAAALYGREFGWAPIVALQYLSVIDGKPTMSAEAMAARIRACGHRLEVVEWTDQACTLKGTHARTGDSEEVTFSMEDAARAGLVPAHPKSGWSKYPKAMLRARATTMIARALFADAIMGISYTPEELRSVEAAPAGDSAPQAPRGRPGRRRKVGAGRCASCDGYGDLDATGDPCEDCSGTGRASNDIPAPPIEPASGDDGGLGELLEEFDATELEAVASEPEPSYVWETIVSGRFPTAYATDPLDPDDPDNRPGEPLSFNVAGSLIRTVVDSGRAPDTKAALVRLAELVADSPEVKNEWAFDLIERMAATRA